jgi:predicted dehydrogenase
MVSMSDDATGTGSAVRPAAAGRAIGRDPWRVGIVGCGNVAFNDHVPAYQALPRLFEVVAVADPSAERQKLVGDRLGLSADRRHGSAEELFDRGDIDVLDICTPPAMHRRLIEAAAELGRHVLCEKPLATTPADAEAITAAVAARAVTLGMIHNYLWFPEVLAMRARLAEGAIGELQVVLIDSLGVDDNPGTTGYRPAWRHESEAGGGVLMDLIHLVYIAESLLGAPIERVSATVDSIEPGAAVESLALCRFESASASALVNVGWGLGPGGLRASGTNGRVEIRYRDGGSGPYAPIEVASLTQRGGETQPLVLGNERDTHRAAFEDFGIALCENRPSAADAAAGARAVAATVAAYASAAMGRTVELPLDPSDPVFVDGVGGIARLPLPPWSVVRRRGLFGVQHA